MEMNENRADMRALVVIVTPTLAEIARHIFREAEVPVRYEVNGEGTASREWMNMLGLGSAEKKILISVLPKETADAMAEKLGRSLPLKKAGTGIIFTLPAAKMQDFTQWQKENAERNSSQQEITCYMVSVIAKKGCSEQVMDAARTVGATGGTVIHGTQIQHRALVRAWNLRNPETKEIILILSEAAKTQNLMKAVEEQCGQDSDVQAKAYASPVDEVQGLDYYLQ